MVGATSLERLKEFDQTVLAYRDTTSELLKKARMAIRLLDDEDSATLGDDPDLPRSVNELILKAQHLIP